MNARTRRALTAAAALAGSTGLVAPALAQTAASPASLTAAFPSESALSAIAGTQMAYGSPAFTSTPIYAVEDVPGSPTVTRSSERYARSFASGGVEVVSVFVTQHTTPAGARTRVLDRLRSDEGTNVTSPGIGGTSRTYTVKGGDVVTRAVVGNASLGAWVTGSKASPATLKRVSEQLARSVARNTPTALAAGAPVVPAYLQRVIPPVPAGWQNDGAVAIGMSSAAVDGAPGDSALRTKGWGTFQYVMGLARSAGTTQVVESASHATPSSASALSMGATGIPFGNAGSAAGYVALLPKNMPKSVAVPITVTGAAAAKAMRTQPAYGVAARVAAPWGDAMQIWCSTQKRGRLTAEGITRCSDAIAAQARAWVQGPPR